MGTPILNLYKLEEVQLNSGLSYNESIYDDEGHWETYAPRFIPDSLIIFIATSTNDTVYWGGTANDVYGNIINVNSLRESFDEKKGFFTFDDIEFKASNISGFWSNYVFSPEIETAEIRIVCKKASGGDDEITYSYEALFAGKILMDDYTEDHNDETTSTYFDKTKIYEIRAFNILKVLEEKTIDELRTAIIANTLYVTKTKATMEVWREAMSGYQTKEFEFIPGSYFGWRLILLSSIVYEIIKLTGLTINNFVYTSDFHYFQKDARDNLGVPDVTVSDLLIPYSLEAESGNDRFMGKIFDNDTTGLFDDGSPRLENDKTPWSFYQYTSVMELFKNLLLWAGQIPRLDFIIPDTNYLYQFSLNASIVQRKSRPGTITINNLLKAKKKVTAGEKITGYKVSTPGIGDALVGTNANLETTCLFGLTEMSNVRFDDPAFYEKTLPSMQNALYFEYNNYLYPVTNVGYTLDGSVVEYNETHNVSYDVDGEQTLYPEPYQLNRNLILAIANYYANATHGLWSTIKTTYELEYSAIKGTLGSSESYNYLKPNYDHVYNGDLCIITKTDRDLLKCKTKIEMVKY